MLKDVLILALFVATCALGQGPTPTPQPAPTGPVSARGGHGALKERTGGWEGWDIHLPQCKVGRRPMLNQRTKKYHCVKEKKAKQ